MSQLNCLSVPQNSIVGSFISVSSSSSLTAAIYNVSSSSTFPSDVCNFPFIDTLYRSLIHILCSLYVTIKTYMASVWYCLSLASTWMLLILDKQSACFIFFPDLYSMSKLYFVSFSIHLYLLLVGFS